MIQICETKWLYIKQSDENASVSTLAHLTPKKLGFHKVIQLSIQHSYQQGRNRSY